MAAATRGRVDVVRDDLQRVWRGAAPGGGDMDAKLMASWTSRVLAGQASIDDFQRSLPTAGEVTPSTMPGDLAAVLRHELEDRWPCTTGDAGAHVARIEAGVAVILQTMSVPAAAVAAYMQLHVALEDARTMRVLEVCEARFGRPLFVHEFLSHRAALYDRPDCLLAAVAALHSRHVDAFARVGAVHRRLLGHTDFDEERFVMEYVAAHGVSRGLLDDPADFAARLELRVLAGQEYADAVGGRLCAIHAQTFDTAMPPHLLGHMVETARSMRLGPVEPQDIEALHRLVVDVYRQTERFRAMVCGVYVAVLERAPEADEEDRAVEADYDGQADCDNKQWPRHQETRPVLAAAELRLGLRLAAGLEFCDVLKRRLRAGSTPAMYTRLQAVVARLQAGELKGHLRESDGELILHDWEAAIQAVLLTGP